MTSWTEFRQEIDRRLDAVRPPRSGTSERDWREPVYGWARNHIPDETNVVRHFAQQEVDKRETRATRRGNRYLRQWARGQRPLTWADLGPLPVVVDHVRIRLDAVTPDDMEDAADQLAAEGKRNYDEVVLLVSAMRELAKSARRDGRAIVAQIGDLKPHNDGMAPQVDDDDDWADDDEATF